MKALSIRQPWAWLITQGWKTVENRSWDTKFRGEFLIHAGKSMTQDDWDDALQTVRHADALQKDKIISPMADAMVAAQESIMALRGGIVGQATLINTVPRRDFAHMTNRDRVWAFGEYAFVLDNIRARPFRPLKGQLGFFEVENVIDLDKLGRRHSMEANTNKAKKEEKEILTLF